MALVSGSPNAITNTYIDNALKQVYLDSQEAALFFIERPAFGMIPKDERMGGRNVPEVLHFARTGGRSAIFSYAQTISSFRNKRIRDFLMTPVEDWSIIRVPGKTMAMTRNSTMAWEDLVASFAQKGLDDAEENLAEAIEMFLYRDGTGVLATIAASASTKAAVLAAPTTVSEVSGAGTTANMNYVLLNEADAALLFENGEYVIVILSTTDPTYNTGGEVFCVEAVDTFNNIIACRNAAATENLGGTTYTDLAVSRYITKYGDNYYASTANVKIAGFSAWCPTTTPVAGTDSFYGMDRSESSRLFGKYMDYSIMSRQQALVRAATVLAKEGGQPTTGLMAFTAYRGLLDELDLRKEVVDMNPTDARGLVNNISYKGVVIQGPRGPIQLTACAYQLPDECLLMRPEDWKLLTVGPAMSLEDRDGLSILRLPDSDAYEGRMVFRGNLECLRPGRQGRVKLQATVA
jgi:hypothetical protein